MPEKSGDGADNGGGTDADAGTGPDVEGGPRAASDAGTSVDPSVLHLSPAEREARGITDDEVREAFRAVLVRGTEAQKDLSGVTLPDLSLDRIALESVDRHPVDLSGATIEGLSLTHAR